MESAVSQSIVVLHVLSGVVALCSFWVAGLAKKGSPLHLRAGKIYLSSMIGIVITALYLAASFFVAGKTVAAIFLSYLVLITATAMWLAWTAVRRKRDQARFRDRTYVAIALVNVVGGAIVFAFGVSIGDALLMGFCWVGIVLGTQMLMRAWKPLAETKWWLREHIGATLGCGIATHVAFLGIGVNRLTAALPINFDLGLLPWFGPVVVALVAGAWLDRKYLRAPPLPSISPVR